MIRLRKPFFICPSIAVMLIAVTIIASCYHTATAAEYQIKPLTEEQAELHKLDRSFYKKCTMVQGILIATSGKVSDLAHQEAAYQFDMIMQRINPEVAQRVRDREVLCILIGHDELTSELPQYGTDKTGEELDFYNWRSRGFLSWPNGRPTVVFAEEDVLEYEGGMKIESILIHEFGHVIHGAGFSKEQQERLTKTFEEAKVKGLWNDGYAAQRFRRVKSEKPVSLKDALVKSFPDISSELIEKCLEGGDILVNGEPTSATDVTITKDDKVRIVFGGEKECYAGKNRAEYWAEAVQSWYDTNRTNDHDHNHIHTRKQLKEYDPGLAKMCKDILGDSPWRFVSPCDRAGSGHLKTYDPATAPTVEDAEHIKKAANDYYDAYWCDYWQRLEERYATSTDANAAKRPNVILIMADDMGYECLGANGGESYTTPRLDQLAAGGIRFENCHSQPICTPSRVQIMTGIYNNRNYIRFGLLDGEARTFGNLFQDAGYETVIAGKWQLDNGFQGPYDFGFDEYCLWQLTRIGGARAARYPNPGLEINGKEVDFTGGKYGPEIVSDFLCDFIERKQDEPFFVYYPMILPHFPFQPTPDSDGWIATESREYPSKEWKNKWFADMVGYTDKVVGKLVDKLDELDLRDDTLIIFTGDNGTYMGMPSEFQGETYLGGKGTPKDSGTHVPMIVNWPGTTDDSQVSQSLVDFSDMLPTIAEIAGIEVPEDWKIDGVSFAPEIRGEGRSPRELIYCWYQRNGVRDTASQHVRTAKFKLYSTGKLYDVINDFHEKKPLDPTKLNDEDQAVYQKLQAALQRYTAITETSDPIQLQKQPRIK